MDWINQQQLGSLLKGEPENFFVNRHGRLHVLNYISRSGELLPAYGCVAKSTLNAYEMFPLSWTPEKSQFLFTAVEYKLLDYLN
jgi:hypothetical protein